MQIEEYGVSRLCGKVKKKTFKMKENAVIILLIKSFLYCNIHNKYLLFMFDMDRGKELK